MRINQFKPKRINYAIVFVGNIKLYFLVTQNDSDLHDREDIIKNNNAENNDAELQMLNMILKIMLMMMIK